MVIRRERGSGWDHPRWPRHTALIAVVLAPVLVGTGVTAHYRVVPADKALAALVVAVLLGIGLERLRSAPTGGGSTLLPVPGWLRRTGSANLTLPPLMSLATAELLAAWSTVWVELGRLPWLGLVAALLPASLAAALWLAAQLRDISAPPANSETGTVAGLSLVRARTLFHGLLVLALAVPLLITLSGLDAGSGRRGSTSQHRVANSRPRWPSCPPAGRTSPRQLRPPGGRDLGWMKPRLRLPSL
jgi:hypothetical protein